MLRSSSVSYNRQLLMHVIMPMVKERKSRNRYKQAWIEAGTRHHLTPAQIQMACELRLNPAELDNLDRRRYAPWKLRLPEFIEALYFKRFGKTAPDSLPSFKERPRRGRGKKEAQRALRRQHIHLRQNFRLADDVQYMQGQAAERRDRIVTVGPLLLFATGSGDAWILDPADHLASPIAKGGAPRSIYMEEGETTFAIGWQGRYDIVGATFVFTDRQSGDVTTIVGYPTRQIADRIAEVFGSQPS